MELRYLQSGPLAQLLPGLFSPATGWSSWSLDMLGNTGGGKGPNWTPELADFILALWVFHMCSYLTRAHDHVISLYLPNNHNLLHTSVLQGLLGKNVGQRHHGYNQRHIHLVSKKYLNNQDTRVFKLLVHTSVTGVTERGSFLKKY